MGETEFDCNGMYKPILGALKPVSKKITPLGSFLAQNSIVLEVSYKSRRPLLSQFPVQSGLPPCPTGHLLSAPSHPFTVTLSVNYKKMGGVRKQKYRIT